MVREGAAPHFLFMEMPGLRLPVRGSGILRFAVRGHRGLRNQPPDAALVSGMRINLVRRGEMLADTVTKPHHLIASDRVEGTAVRRPNGDKIGHIERLMIDKLSGKVSYAVLSIGGVFGMGGGVVALPLGRAEKRP